MIFLIELFIVFTSGPMYFTSKFLIQILSIFFTFSLVQEIKLSISYQLFLLIFEKQVIAL